LDLLVISSGSPYDPVFQPGLGQFLRETEVPFVFICHFNAETFLVDDSMREAMCDVFQRAKATVFVSHENQRLTERQLGTAVPRASVIFPPLCTSPSEPLPWPENEHDQLWRFACVARLEPRWKGQDVLFEVLADGDWRHRDYQLSLFGQGAEEAYLKRLCKFYGLEDKVVFAGFSSPMAIWRDHHLQVLATRGEGGPMVVTEGMACGRPAVTTRCGFNTEYISDGGTGFLAAFATADCFGAKMDEAWNRRDEWKAMGAAAHRSIHCKLADFNASERLLELLLSNGNSNDCRSTSAAAAL
jgi:glycosyltransferase involved in cell wall biosynthesis